MPRSQPHEAFDYEVWVESVTGKTLRVTAWEGTKSEHAGPAAARETYCAECDEDVMLLVDDVIGGEKVGHCPTCGSLPGLHEMERESGPRVVEGAWSREQ